jgi:hypothetical protein
VRRNYVLGEFGTPKSKRSTRSVPMADEVAGELERLIQKTGAKADDALVFPDPHTRCMRRAMAASAFARPEVDVPTGEAVA